MIQRTLDELLREVKKKGIDNQIKPTGRGGLVAKRDIIEVLARYNIIQRYGSLENISKNLKYRLSFESPMLCYQYTRLKPEEQKEIWEADNWWLTEKENGVRAMLIYSPNEGLSIFSRNISVEDYLPPDYGDKLLNAPVKGIKRVFAVDVEIKSTNPNIRTFLRNNKGVETETELQAIAAILSINKEDSLEIQRTQMLNEPLLEFKMIDVLYWNKDLRKETYLERQKYFDEVVFTLKEYGLNIKRIKYCKEISEKRAFHEGILKNKGEGTVAVNINSIYNDSVNRHRDEWIKIKRTVSESFHMEGMGDSIDGFITGFEIANEEKGFSGLVGALEVSIFLQKKDGSECQHVIAMIPNIALSLRKEMTEVREDGTIQLKQEFYDRVVEVNGQVISARAKRLTHPRMLQFRPDKTKYECCLDEGFLESQIL